MDILKSEGIESYINNQLKQGESQLSHYIYDTTGRPKYTRAVFLVGRMHLTSYMHATTDPRWLLFPGLRGTGKTTLLAQLYHITNVATNHKIYVSLDDVTRNLGATLKDVLDKYEEILGKKYEELDTPVYLFLDEVQYDPNWGAVLKSLYDRTHKVFLVCTGSSALSLQTNPDVSRRSNTIKVFPLTFWEFQLLKYSKKPISGLANSLRLAIFNSPDAETADINLQRLQGSVSSYWRGVDPLDITTYLKYGTLPFTLNQKTEASIYMQINQTLNNVLNNDVPKLNKFDKLTIDKLSQVLYAIASTDKVSVNGLARALDMDNRTLNSILEAFKQTEVLIPVMPLGGHFKQIHNPVRYHFCSPAYRSMYYNLIGSTETFDQYKGKLLEDTVAMYLVRILSSSPTYSLTYDSSDGGADFIVGFGTSPDKIVIEVGMGKKDKSQVLKTMERTTARFGIVISQNDLEYNKMCNCIFLPIQYFLLM